MRVGNLPQASIRSRGTFAFQMMRVFIVTVIAASGALIVSLSVGGAGSSLDSLAVADRPEDGAVAVAEAPGPGAPVRVAAADPLASLPMDGGAARQASLSQVFVPQPLLPEESAQDAAVQDAAVQEVAVEEAAVEDGVVQDNGVQDNLVPGMPAQAGPVPESASAPGPVAGPAARPSVTPAGHAAAPAAPIDAEMTGAVAVASLPGGSGPADDLVDLNTASVEQLNALRNAGSIARAIIRHRPYASVDDLVKRRILRRSVYEKVKDQVTVR